MNKLIYTFNRSNAEEVVFGKPYIVISIYSSNSTPANIKLNKECLGVLTIEFDDIDEEVNGLRSMTNDDSKMIWDFVLKYKDMVDIIMVHCDGGICRSPAIAAALDKYLNDNEDYQWFKTYIPNKHVYKTMMDNYPPK